MSENEGKYGKLISKAKKASKPDSQPASKQDDPEVNLCIRVPKSQREWWAGNAKMNGTTMTDIIKKALENEFGLPPNKT